MRSKYFHLKLEPRLGTDIDSACREAIRLLAKFEMTVEFRFNGILMFCKENDLVEERILYYNNYLMLRRTT